MPGKKKRTETKEGEEVAADGCGVGNTSTPQQKKYRSTSKKGWFFTLNNYTEVEMAVIKKSFEDMGEKYHVGFEIGESGTPHLQGAIILKQACRLDERINISRIHWEKLGDESMWYTQKEGKPFISRGIKSPIIDDFIGLKPHWWQLEILDLLKSQPDPRKIYVYIDKKGGSGKSTFARHLCLTSSETIKVTGKGNDVKYMMASALEKGDISCVIWDLPRDCANYISYGALEEIKDGHICSGKYESKSIIFNRPHVIIFSNELPATEKLSRDKWVIRYINEDESTLDDLETESDL